MIQTLFTTESGYTANKSEVLSQKAAPVRAGPTLLSAKSMTENETDTDSSDVECPACGRDDFKTESGMKIHHSKVHGESIAGVTVECAWCGSTFQKYQCEVRESEGDFCTSECQHEWRSENRTGEDGYNWRGSTVETACDWCGASIDRRIQRVNGFENSFCNHMCRAAWVSENMSGDSHPLYQSTELSCVECGEITTVQPAELEQHENHFCSDGCRGSYYSGENNYLWREGYESTVYDSSAWSQVRERALERDGYACRICGTPKEKLGRQLHVHHIRPIREFDTPSDAHTLNNAVTLCSEHHAEVESGERSCPDPNQFPVWRW